MYTPGVYKLRNPSPRRGEGRVRGNGEAKSMDAKIKKLLGTARITPFQAKVLKVVSGIPKGRVRTYGWVARRCGRPGASRAVGQALSRNPFPFTIPCHRVVRSDYGIGGFMYGRLRKILLLRREGLTVRNSVVIISEDMAYAGRGRRKP